MRGAPNQTPHRITIATTRKPPLTRVRRPAEIAPPLTLQMVKRYDHLTDSHVKSVVTKMNQNVFATEPLAPKREVKPLPGRAPRKPVSRPSAS